MNDAFDKNLSVDKATFDSSVTFYDVTKPPFKLYGNCISAKNIFARMPENIAEKVSPGVAHRAAMSAGVRCRFSTNSRKIGIKARFLKTFVNVTQSALSAKGFDIYINGKYFTSLRPQPDCSDYYEQLADLGNEEEKDIVLYFPYFSVVDKVVLALDKEANVSEGKDYRHTLPIVFYGSSITQGFCVSRPGNIFSSMVSRNLNTDIINLGFSGVCRGEALMADYLTGIKKSALVCEYDHNEPDKDSLRQNHLNFYKHIREREKTTPIIFISSPNRSYKGQDMIERMKVVEATYKYAVENGDTNTYFINGQSLYPNEIREDCSADSVHPNDLGSYMIAEKIYEKLKKFI